MTKGHFQSLQEAEAKHDSRMAARPVDYVDLYIIHWPANGPTRAWPGMDVPAKAGTAYSIGISNFSVEELQQVLAAATDAPPGCVPGEEAWPVHA